MPVRRLHLVLDPELGPALWIREETAPGRSRALEELSTVADDVPDAISEVITPRLRPSLHRIRVPNGRGSRSRVPALVLENTGLWQLTEALATLVETGGKGPAAELILPFVASGRSLLVAEDLIVMPDLLLAVVLDARAADLVARRRVRIELSERFDEVLPHWRALDAEVTGDGGADLPLLDALVDARARDALARYIENAENTGNIATFGRPEDPGTEPVADLLACLSTPSPLALEIDLPSRRRLQTALDEYVRSGRARVHLTSSRNDLVVRLHQPGWAGGGTDADSEASPRRSAAVAAATGEDVTWLLETCFRTPDATVHPLAALRAVGDVTAEQAAEGSGEVLRLAPTVRTARVHDTGVDWLLTTQEASTFLGLDTPALEAAGVTVMLPRDWTRKKTRMRLESGPPAQDSEKDVKKPGGGVGLDALRTFTWKLAVGDTELTDQEMTSILEAQEQIVRLRGEWVRLDAGTLQDARRVLGTFHRLADAPAHPLPPEQKGEDPASPGHGSPARTSANRTRMFEGPLAHQGQLSWIQTLGLILLEGGGAVAVRADADSSAHPVARLSGHPLVSGPSHGPYRNTLEGLFPAGAGAAPLPAPRTLLARLRSYQLEGLNWLWALDELGCGGILADDMGLGKTMQVLSLLCREREAAAGSSLDPLQWRDPMADARIAGTSGSSSEREQPGPTLLVCPMSVTGSWQREAARFAPGLRVHIHHGGSRIRDESFAAGAADVDLVITTYSLLHRDLEVLRQVPWHRLVLDEAQHVKNPDTDVTRAARRIPALHRLALTGTPVENRLRDLYSLMDMVNPGLLQDRKTFQEKIADPIERGEGDQDADDALLRLNMITAPFLLRRVKTDRSIIDDLPEKSERAVSVNLTPEQAGLYAAVVDESLAEIEETEGKKRRAVIGATLTRLKQVCNHPAHYLNDGSGILIGGEHRSGKLEYVDDLLETAFAQGEKVLLFTQFTAFGSMLVPYWHERFGMQIPFLHGGVTKPDRDAMVTRFQESTGTPGAMLLSLRAGGTGLTLTAANHVVHLDRWWNPAVENQATDRAFRIGQTRDVQVRKLVSAGTLEERIDAVLTSKQHLSDLAVAPADLGDLSNEDLRRLFTYDTGEDR